MRLGILGGTFNPIHNAHLRMATAARDILSLDLVLLVVASDPPHKDVDGRVSGRMRLEMTKLAAAGQDRLEASDLELTRDGKSFTFDTVTHLLTQHPGLEPYLIVGSDMLLDLPNWHRAKELMRLVTVAGIPRGGEDQRDRQAAEMLESTYGARVVLLPVQSQMLSSTEIRDRLYDGLPVDGMLPEAVERYCYETGLYFPRDVRRMQENCRAALNIKRYRHTMRVVRCAAELAQRWNADPSRARTAALLHDCAKCLDPVTLDVCGGDDTGIPSVQHAFAGAVLAKTRYGVTDWEVLRAIRLHCTGEANLSLLDKLIYLADMTEPSRTFRGVCEIRARLARGPDAAMEAALRRTCRHVLTAGKQLHPATLRALDYYRTMEETH